MSARFRVRQSNWEFETAELITGEIHILTQKLDIWLTDKTKIIGQPESDPISTSIRSNKMVLTFQSKAPPFCSYLTV